MDFSPNGVCVFSGCWLLTGPLYQTKKKLFTDQLTFSITINNKISFRKNEHAKVELGAQKYIPHPLYKKQASVCYINVMSEMRS